MLFTLRHVTNGDVAFRERYKGQGKWALTNTQRCSVKMALKGLRVVEMAGLAPAPLAGMILSGELTVVLKK